MYRSEALDAHETGNWLHGADVPAFTEQFDAGSVASLAEITATIAHEIAQPLAAIITSAEAGLRRLARADLDPAKAEQLLARIVASARRVNDIVQRVRRTAANDETDMAPVNLRDVIDEAQLSVCHDLEASSIALWVKLDDSLPIVLADRVQLQQVIVNLLTNSIQAIARADTAIRRISLEAGVARDGSVFVAIRDSGPGIADEHLARVFDSFFTTKKGGTGIGLALCRSIITAHGGHIVVSNRPQGGAQVRFTLRAMRSYLHS